MGQGDQEAFLELFRVTRAGMWRLVRAMIHDDARAEDALQEAYAAVWKSASAWRGEGAARSWLYGLARRQAARSVRRRVGEPARPVPLHELGAQAGWGRSPEELAAAIEDGERLRSALSTLSPADQEVVVLCDLEGLSGPEAAEVLGLTANATRVRLHRARLRLMAALQPEVADA